MKKQLILPIILAFLAAVVPGQGQNGSNRLEAEPAFAHGTKHKIKSAILGEERPYSVFLPESYNDTTYAPGKYPVLYLLSGNELLLKAVTQEMSRNFIDQIPEPIIVRLPVPNSRKYHNYFTPTNSQTLAEGREIPDFLAETGKADDFLSFLGDELLPHIDSSYRTLPYRVLIGHSLAGLFTVHAFLAPPDLFQGFLAIDPSLWWDDRILVKRLEQNVKKGEFPEGEIYIALASRPREGSSRASMTEPIVAFGNLLKTLVTENLHFRLQDFPAEHHASVPIPALYHGLQHIFEGYQPVPDQFSVHPETILPHYQKFSKRIGTPFLPPENLIDQIGQWLLFDATATPEIDQDKMEKAIEVLVTNIKAHPDSYHAHQSLADAYAAMGNKKLAMEHYQRSLELNPENERVKDQLQALME